MEVPNVKSFTAQPLKDLINQLPSSFIVAERPCMFVKIRTYCSIMIEGNNEKSMSLIVLNCDEPFFHFADSFLAMVATWRPWKRAIANSFSLGIRLPSDAAMVVAPYGLPPVISLNVI